MHQTQWSPERPLPPPVSLTSQSHHEKPPEVTCTSRGKPGCPASTRERLKLQRSGKNLRVCSGKTCWAAAAPDKWLNTYNLGPAASVLSREGLSGAASKSCLGACGGPSSPRKAGGSRVGREAAGAPNPEPCTPVRVYMVQTRPTPLQDGCGRRWDAWRVSRLRLQERRQRF